MKGARLYRAQFEEVISTISMDLLANLTADGMESATNHALQTMGKFAGADRCYVVTYSDDGVTMETVYEWCAEGIEPDVVNYCGLPATAVDLPLEVFRRFETIHIPNVANWLPMEGADKEAIQGKKIKSLLVIPMICTGSLFGFIGLETLRMEKTWAEETIGLLRMIGEVFAYAIKCKRSEEALRTSRWRYRLLVESVTDIVWIMDMDLQCLYVSPSVERLRGYTATETVAQKPEQAFSPASLKVLAMTVGEQRATERAQLEETSMYPTLELEIICKGGSTAWVEGKVIFLRDSDGRPVEVLLVASDITEGRQLERERSLLMVGALTLNRQTRKVSLGEKNPQLTPTEFNLLQYLMTHPGEVLSEKQLLEEVWGYPGDMADPSLVRWHIKKLRTKIEPNPAQPVYICTLPRHGYILKNGIPDYRSSMPCTDEAEKLTEHSHKIHVLPIEER